MHSKVKHVCTHIQTNTNTKMIVSAFDWNRELNQSKKKKLCVLLLQSVSHGVRYTENNIMMSSY